VSGPCYAHFFYYTAYADVIVAITTIIIVITIITATISQHIVFNANQPHVTEDVAYRISTVKGLL